MSEHERRRHQRFALRVAIKLRRGQEELSADIVNASQGGCLLLVAQPLAPGEVLGASIPELGVAEARLRVVRCEPAPSGYMVAMCFEQGRADEPTLARLAGDAHKPWLH